MDDLSSGDANLPWIWIIEYLASLKTIDSSVLYDLVKMTPQLPDDLMKTARERIAFRCLEDLFGSSEIELTTEAPSTLDSKIKFDLSESCEDVFDHILRETSVSDLRNGGEQLMKWDVVPFILHKKACMPKCALVKLKEEIYKETDEYSTFLKVRSELVVTNMFQNMTTERGSGSEVMMKVNEAANGCP